MVTVEQVKEYLLQVKFIKKELDLLRDKINEMEARKDLQPLTFQNHIQTSIKPVAGFERVSDSIMDLKKLYNEKWILLIETRHRIIDQCHQVSNCDCLAILALRYGFLMPWADIENNIGKSYFHLIKMQKKALELFGELFETEIMEYLNKQNGDSLGIDHSQKSLTPIMKA